jgi:toxin ParE1/3/4
MDYQVALTPSARRDLRAIVRYISLDSPERGMAFGQFLISSTKRLADFPEMGRTVPELNDPSMREVIARSYRIIYRVDHDGCRVDVLRFWHGARGTPRIEED